MHSGMRWIYRMVGTSVNENMIVATDTRHISNQLGCHESRIGNNTRHLHELMGTLDILKEEVHKLTSMTQWNHCQESPVASDFQMEEPSVTQST